VALRRRRRKAVDLSVPLGVTVDELAEAYPRLYHMAESGSWPSIRRHGLLSTSSLLSLFEVRGGARAKIESAHRPVSVPIRHSEHGVAVVRDQIPMRDADLAKCLRDGITPRDWYELLNSMVFFWLSEERLETLLGARAYRDKSHTVLILDTRALVRDCAPRVMLSPMNSGATRPVAHPRGRETFLPLAKYPFKARRKRSRANAVVELAVTGGILDVERCVIEVVERSIAERGRVIWRP
jgi:hypothetical protein